MILVLNLPRLLKKIWMLEESESIVKWVSTIMGTKLHGKLVNVGLLESVGNTKLEAFVDA